MTTSALTTACRYFDGQVPKSRPATLTSGGNEVVLTAGELTRAYSREKVSVSPRIGSAGRFVNLGDGGQCYCTDHAFLDRLPQESGEEGLVGWLENHLSAAIGSIALVAAFLLIGYFYLLPAAAQSLLQRIPLETEVAFGRNLLEWFDDNSWMQPSEIEPARKAGLALSFQRLYEGLAMSPCIDLQFRNSKALGPNAFALPGGIIVMTDQLVELAESDEEVLAVLAHEAGHVEERHAMRQVLQGSFIALVAATVTADANSAGAAFTGMPAVLLQKKYSRNLEREADRFAFAMLQQHDISPENFAVIMQRLEDATGPVQGFSFLSTHPATAERIEMAKGTRDQ